MGVKACATTVFEPKTMRHISCDTNIDLSNEVSVEISLTQTLP